MVAQKRRGCRHDFTKDPIVTQIIDGWGACRQGTTLGAIIGIGHVGGRVAVLRVEQHLAPWARVERFHHEEETSYTRSYQLEEEILKGKDNA